MQNTQEEKSISPGKAGKKGGRPPSEGWKAYDFEKVDGDKGKCLAKCMRCYSTLKNTSISRMRNHRKKCGIVGNGIQFKQDKVEMDESDREEQQPQAETVTTVPDAQIVWTPTENYEQFVEVSVPVEKVNQTADEIIQNDIQRHRKSNSAKKRHRSSISDTNSIDVSLSSFLIGCNLTFDIIDSPHFKKFMSKVNPNYNVPTSSELKSKILNELENSRKNSKSRRVYESESASDSE